MNRPQASAGSSAEIAAWHRPPILGLTRYDRVSAAMIALLIAMFVLAGWSLALWLSNLRFFVPGNSDTIKSAVLADTGHEITDKPLKVESPADPSKDPSVVDTDDTEPSAELTINETLLVSTEASQRFSKLESSDAKNGGRRGSQIGSDRRPFGDRLSDGTRPPYDRWFIRFSDGGSLQTYAEQLDQFGIELGLLTFKPKTKIEVLSHLSRERAERNTISSGREKSDAMVFRWAGGPRVRADKRLFKTKAGIDATTGTILHFYPQKTVKLLERLEREAAKRPVRDIVRTYFRVTTGENGFRIVVVLTKYKTE